jgi:2-polyprenyl-6-hydroxyphenyl methylase/3-demethylubiquinone-9 3-methyltransferase
VEEVLKPELADCLASLPRLDRANARTASITCKICGYPAPFFDVVDFNKCAGFYAFGPAGVPVHYHRCDECGFLFTPFFDDWTEADFRRFIYNADYILVDPEYEAARPVMVAEHLAQFLDGQQNSRILDYGAGTGAFGKRMSELGFRKVESYDPFSMPNKPSGRFDIVTCTEVIEHIPSPMVALQDMRSLLADQACIILGETLQPKDIGTIRGNWWYVAPRNGHVSTFADRTLATLAGYFGLIFHRGSGHHALRTPGPGPLAETAERFGPAMLSLRLRAPVAEEPAIGFHGLEGVGGQRFRWTATDVLTWQITVPPGPHRLVQVTIPYLHESRHGFAGACRLDVGSTAAAVSVAESAIVAEANEVAPGSVVLTLRTPQPLSPPGDPRRLGLAIEAAERH